MHYFSFLSTYANYTYSPSLFLKSGEFKKDDLTRFFLQKLEKFGLNAKLISGIDRDFFIIYSQEGLEDDIGDKSVSAVPPTFFNFVEEDIQEFSDLLDEFIEELKNDDSDNAKLITKELVNMKLAPSSHYIFFTNGAEEE